MRVTRFRLIVVGALIVAATLSLLYVGVRHVPDFYKRASVPPGPERAQLSADFFNLGMMKLIEAFEERRGPWQFTFTQEQLNSFFEEDFIRFGDADHFRKAGIYEPRLEFNDDQIRFGFRYGGDQWNTVLSYDLKVWVPKEEVNTLVIEIERRRAGAVPLPTQRIFEELSELGRRRNIDVAWYRYRGNPVAVVKFQSDRPNPTAFVKAVNIQAGRLTVRGYSLDPAQGPLEEPIRKVEVSRKD